MAQVVVHGFQLRDAILHNTDLALQVDLGALASPPYGELYVSNNTNSQTFTLQNTYYVLDQGWAAGLVNKLTLDPTNKRIVITQGGVYVLSAIISFAGDNNETYKFTIATNGTPQPNMTMGASCRGAGLAQDVSILGFIALKPGDYFDIRGECTSNPGKSIVVGYADLAARIVA